MTDRSPFHRGEQEIQRRFGVRAQVEEIGQRFVRDHLPDEHRAFYAGLRFIVVGSVDQDGCPWASLLAGRPGFITSPERTMLSIDARPSYGDPLNENLSEGARLGLLGIEYHTRRRNRLTGRLISRDADLVEIHVDQTFGNCPKFIQARDVADEFTPARGPRPVHQLRTLDQRERRIIESADHFFIATHYSDADGDATQGADVSHRGGKPGFVRIDDDSTLTFPDFTGNSHFNTLGNITLDPRAGLLFIDFATGDLLYLTCSARIIWEGDDLEGFVGAERLVRLTIDAGRLVENALQLDFSFSEYSPFLEQTGSWEEVAQKRAAREEGNRYREYKVTRVEPESASVNSFYLEPSDGNRVACHRAGQFLPIQILLPGATAPVQRTYTISNAPNGTDYRLSIKREEPREVGAPPGLASNYFHDHVRPGSTLRALAPRGQFTLDTTNTRPIVLISAGVGITPMISMLEQLNRDRATCGCTRSVWFVHGARNSEELTFGDVVRDLAENWSSLATHVRFSQPRAKDREGTEYDSTGHVDVELLKSLLPFDDHEFYLCGPGAFMESIYRGLRKLNVADARIHYEYFGPGKTLSSERRVSAARVLHDQPPVPVEFARSGIEATWEPGKGTLLDLAESVGLEPPFSCRSGVCQTCAVSVKAGSVSYIDPPGAPPPDGTALICSAYPAKPAADADAGPIVLDM